MTIRTPRLSGLIEGGAEPLILSANGVDYLRLNTNGSIDLWDGSSWDAGSAGDVLVHQGNNAPLWVTQNNGIAPGAYAIVLDSDIALANSNAVQDLFGKSVTLGVGYYSIEYHAVLVKSAGTTSHTVNSLIGGTSTKGNILAEGHAHYRAANTFPASYVASALESRFAHNAATGVVMTQAITAAAGQILVNYNAIVEVTIGGTLSPQVQCSAAPGGAYTVKAGSFCIIRRLGDDGANVEIGSWA
jgi:hypothetical protein